MQVFTPYRVCPLGAHVDHQLGIVTGFAIDKGVYLDFEPTEDGQIELSSGNFPGKLLFSVWEVPGREMTWGDFAKGAVLTLAERYPLKRGFRGRIKGTLPIGGLSSSAAVILTYLQGLCIVNEIPVTEGELVELAIREERDYIGVNVGRLDQSCEMYCKKDCLLVLDTLVDGGECVPTNPKCPKFEIMIVFSGLERSLEGSAYNARVDECKAAAYTLQNFCGLSGGRYADAYLRRVPLEIFEEYKERLPESFRKRGEHYYSEQRRVRNGVEAFREGDLETFGRLIFESGRSSIENYETGSTELSALQEIMEQTKGVYGGRFSGAGFNGSSMAIVDPGRREEIRSEITEKYIRQFPWLEGDFSIHFCKTADGVGKYM